MLKAFCDLCKEEMSLEERGQLAREHRGFTIRTLVEHGKSRTPDVHLCCKCHIETLQKGSRPKPK